MKLALTGMAVALLALLQIGCGTSLNNSDSSGSSSSTLSSGSLGVSQVAASNANSQLLVTPGSGAGSAANFTVPGSTVSNGTVTNTTTNTTTNTSFVSTLNSTVSAPQGIAIDRSSGDIYVAQFSGGYSKFDASGNLLGTFGTTSPGQVISGVGIAVDSTGHVYVGDYGASTAVEFDSSGAYVQTFSTPSGTTQLGQVTGVALDAANNLWVADDDNSRVVEFSQTGAVLNQFSTQLGQGGLAGSVGIAFDQAGNLWVAEYYYQVAAKFDATTGALLTTYGSGGSTIGAGIFGEPYGLTVDPNNNVIVTDGSLGDVQIFSDSGTFISYFGGTGTSPQFTGGIGGAAVSNSGLIYLSIGSNVEIFQLASGQ